MWFERWVMLFVSVLLVGSVVILSSVAIGVSSTTAAADEQTELTVSVADHDGTTPDTGLVTVERLSDGETVTRELDGCCVSLSGAFLEDGEYRISFETDTEYWGDETVSITAGQHNSVEFQRSAPWITDWDVEDADETTPYRRYGPGETVPAEIDLDISGIGSASMAVELYIYQGDTWTAPEEREEFSPSSWEDSTQRTIEAQAPFSEEEYLVAGIVTKEIEHLDEERVVDRFLDVPMTVEEYAAPEITDATPASESVLVSREGSRTFEIDVSHERFESDDLDIVWEAEGTQVDDGTALEYDPGDRSLTHDLTVAVKDGKDQTETATREWEIDVRRPPEIQSVSPETDEFVAPVSESILFSVDADNPDSISDDLVYNWATDEIPDSPGTVTDSSLEYTESEPTERTLAVRVDDETDVTDGVIHTWDVQFVEPLEIVSTEPASAELFMRETEEKTLSASATAPGLSDSTLEYRWKSGTGFSETELGTGETFVLEGSALGTGEHTVRAVATDGFERTPDDEAQWTVTVAGPPQIDSISPTTVTPGESVSLTVDASDHSQGPGIEQLSWEIGDETYNGETVTHTFESTGEKSVTVTATTEDGVSVTESFTVTVESAAPVLDELSLEDGQTVQAGNISVSAAASVPADRDVPLNYTWETRRQTFEGAETDLTLRHVGEQEITLRVETPFGETTERTLRVQVENTPPSIERTDPSEGEPELPQDTPQRFAAKVINPDAEPATVEVYIDGEQVDESLVFDPEAVVEYVHEFEDRGPTTARFVVRDQFREEATVQWDATVLGPPPEVVDRDPDDDPLTVESGETVTFEIEGRDPDGGDVSYEWYVDDFLQTEGKQLTQTFEESGTTGVFALLENQYGHTVSEAWTVEVRDFRSDPVLSDQTSDLQFHPDERSATLISIAADNPDVNARDMRIEFIVEPPDGIDITETRNVQQASGSSVRWIGDLAPGQQQSLRIGIDINDESLYGSDLTIPYEIRYYPADNPEDYTVVERQTANITVLEPDDPSDSTPESSDALPVPEDQPGFGLSLAASTLLILLAWVLRRSGRS